jgi:hypothetical protein
MTAQTIYCPDTADWENILVGHRVLSAEQVNEGEAYLTLDNGVKFKVEANEGCGGCTNGYYYIEKIVAVDNIITAVRTEVEPRNRDKYDEDAYVYHVFVVTGNEEIEALTVEGDDGNGYYGTGYSLRLLEG